MASATGLKRTRPASARPWRVGLTGGIASGKSTVARLFTDLGVALIDADQVARDLVVPGSPALAAISAEFGPGILSDEGQLNRQALRQRIFADAAARVRLEKILHPQIRARMLAQADAMTAAPYLIWVVPLLVESGWQHLVDRVLLVDCSEQAQLARLMRRDGIREDLARAMLTSQASRTQRRALADDCLVNETEADRLQLAESVRRLHLSYLRQCEDSPG